MKINSNMMANIQRRFMWTQDDAVRNEQPGKQDSLLKTKEDQIADNLKSRTERLLSYYFDIEI